MARDVKKYIDEYNRKYVDNNNDQFFVSDIMQIKELSEGDFYKLISSALTYGFMIGCESMQKASKSN